MAVSASMLRRKAQKVIYAFLKYEPTECLRKMDLFMVETEFIIWKEINSLFWNISERKLVKIRSRYSNKEIIN